MDISPQENVDFVDDILAQWTRERPDLDFSPIHVLGRIWRASLIFQRQIEQVFATFGLNVGGFDVLAALRRAGAPYSLTPTALQNSLLVSSGTMTNRLDRLAEHGLIQRVPRPDDRRSILVALSPKGRRLVDAIIERTTATERALLASLPRHNQQQLASLLRDLLLAQDDRSPSLVGQGIITGGRSRARLMKQPQSSDSR